MAGLSIVGFLPRLKPWTSSLNRSERALAIDRRRSLLEHSLVGVGGGEQRIVEVVENLGLYVRGEGAERRPRWAQKRAQAEQFAFDVDAPGLVEVTNESHESPADHQYTVSIDDVTEDLMACTCPRHVLQGWLSASPVANLGGANKSGVLAISMAFHHSIALLISKSSSGVTNRSGAKTSGSNVGVVSVSNSAIRWPATVLYMIPSPLNPQHT